MSGSTNRKDIKEDGAEFGRIFAEATQGIAWAVYQLGQRFGQWEGYRDSAQNSAFAEGFMRSFQEAGVIKNPPSIAAPIAAPTDEPAQPKSGQRKYYIE